MFLPFDGERKIKGNRENLCGKIFMVESMIFPHVHLFVCFFAHVSFMNFKVLEKNLKEIERSLKSSEGFVTCVSF